MIFPPAQETSGGRRAGELLDGFSTAEELTGQADLPDGTLKPAFARGNVGPLTKKQIAILAARAEGGMETQAVAGEDAVLPR